MIWFVLLVQLLIVLGAFAYAVSIGYGIFFGAPYVGTSTRVAKAMLEFAEVTKQDVVLDIGCGAGNILAVAIQDLGVKKVIGYDVNPILIAWARLRFALLQKNVQTEFVARPLELLSPREDVTVVTLYLLPALMQKALPVLAKNIPKNARIISHGFAFEGIKSQAEMRIHNTTLRLYAMDDVIAHDTYERGNCT